MSLIEEIVVDINLETLRGTIHLDYIGKSYHCIIMSHIKACGTGYCDFEG